MTNLNYVDQFGLNLINPQALPGFHDFFTVVTQFGSAIIWTAAFVAYLLIGKNKLIAAVFLFALLFGTVINEDLKDLVRRERPDGAVVAAYVSPINYSFPSQHAQTAFMLATLVAAYFGWRYGLITYPAAALIAMSRMYLGVHYLTDVIGGALIGIAIGELIILAMYLNGITTRGGIIWYLAGLAGIKPPAAPQTDKQKATGLAILMGGICIAATMMVIGWYLISMAVIAIVFMSVIVLPFAYPKYGSKTSSA